MTTRRRDFHESATTRVKAGGRRGQFAKTSLDILEADEDRLRDALEHGKPEHAASTQKELDQVRKKIAAAAKASGHPEQVGKTNDGGDFETKHPRNPPGSAVGGEFRNK